jgi:multidrug resistance efflux pump
MADPVQSDAPHSEGEVTVHPQAAGEREERLARPAATPASTKNPLRRWVLIVLGVAALLFGYHLVADRLTPYIAQAYVQAFVVDIAPEVSGTVVEVDVADNREVQAGQELFRIDPQSFEIAVEAAEAALAIAGQGIGASTAQIASAQAGLCAAEANLANVREQSARVLALVERGVMPAARRDEAEAAQDTANAAVEQAAAAVEEARQRLGPEGADNPQIRAAVAELERARLDLARSTVRAPADGLITNLELSVNEFAQAGAPVMTVIDTRSVWLVAELREKSPERVRPGDAPAVAFDALPGQVFAAKVESIGWGIALPGGRGAAGLPGIGEEPGWVRGPQRFPVLLTLEDELPPGSVRLGSLGAAIVHAGDNPVMHAPAWLRMRLVSLLSYVV